MKEILGSILPEFSSNDRELLKNGLDFIGINQYTSFYVQDCISSICEPGPGVTKTEGYYRQSSQKDGMHIGEPVRNFNFITRVMLGIPKTLQHKPYKLMCQSVVKSEVFHFLFFWQAYK